MSRHEDASLQAIEDKKFIDFLKNLELYDDVLAGKKKCKFCKSVLTLESITYIFPEAGSIKMVCDKPDCINKLLDHINEGKLNG